MGIGPYLRQERELRQVALEQVSEVTRIPRSTLEALEADDHARLPGRAYIVGYLRAYADAVGLDAAELLLRYHEETGETPAMAPPAPPPIPLWTARMPWLVAAGVIVVIGLVLIGVLSS